MLYKSLTGLITMISLFIQPQEATRILLKSLPTRRMRDVIGKRFALKGGRKKTLESIGGEYKITRERVRQIETEALRHLRKQNNAAELQPLFRAFEAHLVSNGGVMAEHDFFANLAKAREHPHLALLLSVNESLRHAPETDFYHARWGINKDKIEQIEKVVSQLVSALSEKNEPVERSVLGALLSPQLKEILGEEPSPQVVDACISTSKVISQNPYNEYGLSHWSVIQPRGVRDKAFVVLAKSGKPMHFTDVALAIDGVGWSKKRAHPQTVHNELIKDQRFVLVGRGLYALREWGYEPGVVRDVLLSLFKKANRPLDREEIIQSVSEKRFVKPQTILLNLQNKSLFKKTEEGKYTLV